MNDIYVYPHTSKIPSEGKYKTIREYEVEKYEYTGHKYKD